MRKLIPLLGFLVTSSLFAQPVDRAITRCSTIPVPGGFSTGDLEIERCAEDVAENAIWQVDPLRLRQR